MTSITYGSVCSGIEAFSVAVKSLDWKAEWLAEIETTPCIVLAHHYPEVPNLGDMTKIAAMVRSGAVAAPDVLVGGTPCQAFSIAGLRNSLDDARGQLSLSFVDLANAIDTARIIRGKPAASILWENVPGVLNTKDNAFGCFLGALSGEDDPVVPPGKKWANAGCVFGPQRTVAWRVLDAQYFGVAQRRRRVFVIASARNGFDPTAVLFERDGLRRDFAPSRQAGQDVAGSLGARASSGGGFSTDFECAGGLQPVCPTLRAGGNKTGGDRPPGTDVDTADSLIICLTHGQGGAELGIDRAPTLTCNHEAPIAAYSTSGAGYWRDGVGALRGRAQDSHENLAIAFSCKDNGRDATNDLSPTLRSMGHSGSHQNGGGQMAVCITGDITHTLKAEGFDGSEDGTGRGNPIVAAFQSSQSGVRLHETHATLDANNGPRRHNGALIGMAVRRLTPKECARLQGFPDLYLSSVLRNGKSLADGPMYKAFGNSMAVPNMAWLGRRIDSAIRSQA